MGIKNSKGNEVPCVLQGLFPPGTTDFGCFSSCAQWQDPGAGGGSYMFRASPSSALHLSNDTGDIAGVTFKNHKCKRSCQTTGIL